MRAQQITNKVLTVAQDHTWATTNPFPIVTDNSKQTIATRIPKLVSQNTFPVTGLLR